MTPSPDDAPSSLSMVPSPPTSGGAPLTAAARNEAAAANPSSSSHNASSATNNKNNNEQQQQQLVDFVGSSAAVKDLFSLPYTSHSVSVAIHNLEGTLFFDRDTHQHAQGGGASQKQQQQTIFASSQTEHTTTTEVEGSSLGSSSCSDVSQALVALSSLEPSSAASAARNDSLAVVNSFLNAVDAQQKRQMSQPGDDTKHQQQQQQHNEFVQNHQTIPPTPEPREYLSWKFHDMNLLVGSDSLILREKEGERSSPNNLSLAVRVEDVQDLQTLVKQHQSARQSGAFRPDHQRPLLQQQGKPSFAAVLTKNSSSKKTSSQTREEEEEKRNDAEDSGGFAAPNLDEVKLQTCIVPSPAVPVGGLLDVGSGSSPSLEKSSDASEQPQTTTTTERATMVSPVSTVLDAYLDNIMANVPQLALCLREKGFIQSVKLLETDKIPSAFLHPKTMDTSKTFDVASDESEQVFSPQVMEMNATALLRFLKLNCTKDNATYLLRREVGQTNLHLYDISSISDVKQKKWLWWLAMMSCRFAHRLRNISSITQDASKRRSFRNRERGLLQNALEMLEVLTDMDGTRHETLEAGVRENLADTFLRGEEDFGAALVPKGPSAEQETASPEPATSKSVSQQPYATLTVDALNKAHDHLSDAIKCLFPQFEKKVHGGDPKYDDPNKATTRGASPHVESIDGSSSDESDEEEGTGTGEADTGGDLELIATATQLFGLHEKTVNVSLRLAEIHLRNYYSSSAMQSLRTAARRLADSLYILDILSSADPNPDRDKDWLRHIQLQYVWLWEHLSHFARSFAGDSLWRERGHAAADDVLIVLQDAESAFTEHGQLNSKRSTLDLNLFVEAGPISLVTNNTANFHSLSGIVQVETREHKKNEKIHEESTPSQSGMKQAREICNKQRFLQREERRVIIAACLAYKRAVNAFQKLDQLETEDATSVDDSFLALLQQRLGDSCNEAGKHLTSELRNQLSQPKGKDFISEDAAHAFLSSAEFWFRVGLEAFEESRDIKNLVLLRLNLCQCYKLKANALFAAKETTESKQSTHAEGCLQEAANILEVGHELLGERSSDTTLWDMVSAELAATFLVLGVRRRQALIGNTPMILQALRLSPGQERSVVDPIEKALTIWEESGNLHQAAAAHYQLALFYSKIWTCQRDEQKTREKLALAFKHYSAAHQYFNNSVKGNELTLCLVCIDLSNLYSSVPGEEGLAKALFCCLDTMNAFETANDTTGETAGNRTEDWFRQMDTVATSVEDRVFKLLRSLVKKFDDGETRIPYKDIYRASLQAKMLIPKPKATEPSEVVLERLSGVHSILKATSEALTKLGLK